MSGPMLASRVGERISLDFPMNDPVEERFDKEEAMRGLLKEFTIADVRYSPTIRMLLIRLDDKYSR